MEALATPLNLFLGGAGLVMLFVGLISALVMPGIEPWSRRFFIVFYSVFILCSIVTVVDMFMYENPNMVAMEVVAIYLEFLLVSLLLAMPTVLLLHCCGEDWPRTPLFRAVLVLWCIFFAVLGIAQVVPGFYYITPENLYYQGPLHPLLLAPIALILFVDIFGLFHRRKKLPRKTFNAFLIYLFPMTIAMIVHAFAYAVYFVEFGIALCMLAMLLIMLSYQVEENNRQEREIAHQRANITVLQMRPHFIYNTMTSIYYLCEQDPKAAQQVTLDFTTYLRKNFNAIASENTIPFSEELEHTRAYLAVEQAQFEDALFVEFDTPHTQFRLPPLTLQPIVENSVKHGMDPDSGPLHICIRTRNTRANSVIVVEDDGAGFIPDDVSGPHGALANIRQRLQMMCDGSIRIASRVGGGTVVTVTIPLQTSKDDQ